MPGSKLGAGELTHPVAHVKRMSGGNYIQPGDPCMQGVSREELAAAADSLHIVTVKGTIWATEALWDL